MTAALPATATEAQAQIAEFEHAVVREWSRYRALRKKTMEQGELLDQARDRLMLVRLTALGEFAPTPAVGSNGSWRVTDGDPLPLVERRRYFQSTDLGRQLEFDRLAEKRIRQRAAELMAATPSSRRRR